MAASRPTAMTRIYLDHGSTVPLLPEAYEAMQPYLAAGFGVPSSPHARGAMAREALETARRAVAALLSADAAEIVFTGSATEANNLALKGIVRASGRGPRHVAAASTEHLSVLHPLRTLEKEGASVTLLPVDRDGFVDPDDLRRALRPETMLVSVAHASAEIGTLQPIAELCRVAHEAGVAFHCDATVTGGRVPWPAGGDRPDLVTVASHLLGGPAGVAALRVRDGLRIAPLIEGGAQERGLRAGTEPVAAAVGFGAAATLARTRMAGRAVRDERRATTLLRLLRERIDGIVATGHPTLRVPGLVTLCLRAIEAEALLSALDEAGIEAASGSACTTEVRKPSHVLTAIGIDPILARGAMTFAFGETNGEADAESVAGILPGLVERLRALSPLP